MEGSSKVKNQSNDEQYAVLSGDTFGHPESEASVALDENSHSLQKNPAKNPHAVNNRNKVKAKNSDDEASTKSDVKDLNPNEPDSASVSTAKTESKGLVSRRRKRINNKRRQQKKNAAAAAKMKATSDEPKNNKEAMIQTKKDEGAASTSSIALNPKPVETLKENKDCILEQFDPLWAGESKNDETLDVHGPTEPFKVPSTEDQNVSVSKRPDLKVLNMGTVQEHENPMEEVVKYVVKQGKDEQAPVKATVGYEGIDGAKPVTYNNYDTFQSQATYSNAAAVNTVKSDLPKDWVNPSGSEELPVFVQPRKNPWHVWPGLFEEGSGTAKSDTIIDIEHEEEKKTLESWLEEPTSMTPLQRLLFEDDYKKKEEIDNNIADFFAEEARCLNEQDIAKYTNDIEIGKIEIYEEDIKRYHQRLKYHRGPVDHDIIFTTVETALNFIEKLTKEREQKKKVGFLPGLFEKCLKSKAQIEQEKEEEERKKKEKEEKKKQEPLKPKMWLVFNRLSKEKVLICTPGEFYDSD